MKNFPPGSKLVLWDDLYSSIPNPRFICQWEHFWLHSEPTLPILVAATEITKIQSTQEWLVRSCPAEWWVVRLMIVGGSWHKWCKQTDVARCSICSAVYIKEIKYGVRFFVFLSFTILAIRMDKCKKIEIDWTLERLHYELVHFLQLVWSSLTGRRRCFSLNISGCQFEYWEPWSMCAEYWLKRQCSEREDKLSPR